MPEANKRPTIGMLINQIEGKEQSPIWNGVADQAEENGCDLVILAGKSLRSPVGDESCHNTIYGLADTPVLDGIIVTSASVANYIGQDELLKFLKNFRALPTVSVSLALDGVPSVIVDNIHGMRQAVEHLLDEHGFRRIAFIRGPETNPEAQERYSAFMEVLNKREIAVEPDLVVKGDFRIDSGAAAVKVLLDERKVKFEAIIAANDDMAQGAFLELKTRGIRVPEDVAVTGFDDIEDIKNLAVPFTTVHQPLYEQGRKAAELLSYMMNGEPVPNLTILPTRLVIRQSCGCMSENVPLVRARTAGKGKDFEASLKEKRQDVILEAMDTLYLPDAEKKQFFLVIDSLINSLIDDLKDGVKNGFFIKSLNHMLSIDLVYESLLPSLQRTMFVLRSSLLDGIEDPSVLYLADGIFQSAQLVISDLIHRRESQFIQQAYNLFWDLREIVQNINSTFDRDKLMKVIANELPRVGIKSCYISFYQIGSDRIRFGGTVLPRMSRLMMAYDENGEITLKDEDKVYPTEQILPRGLPLYNERHTLIILPLFSEELQFGFIAFKRVPREAILYETLRKQISGAVMGAELFNERRAAEVLLKTALHDLERTNQELRNLSIRDELTGLYNRRGLFILGEQHFKLTKRGKGKFLLFFADLDGLKAINDTYGHSEGDNAILHTAEILNQTFRQSDIVARFGGDEFVVVAGDSRNPEDDIRIVRSRLEKNIEKQNLSLKKNYKLSISLGQAIFDPQSSVSFEELMIEADKKLYEQKRLNRQTGE